MDPVKNVVTPMAQNLNGGKWVVPPLVLGCFYAFHRVHRIWRWYRRFTDIYTRRDNFQKLVTGHVFHYIVGQNALVRIAAQTVLIARRVMDCAQQHAAFAHAYHLWVCALKGQCWPRHSPDSYTITRHRGIKTLLSPSTVVWWSAKRRALVAIVRRVVVCTYYLFKEGFKLSMCYMDAIEAFSLSVERGNESINDVFINSTRLLEELTANKRLLLEELRLHRDVIQRLLTCVGSAYTVDQLVVAVGGTIDWVDAIYRWVEWIPADFREGFKDGLYTMLFITTGWAPNCLLPRQKLMRNHARLWKKHDNNRRPHSARQAQQNPYAWRYYAPPFRRGRTPTTSAHSTSQNPRLHT